MTEKLEEIERLKGENEELDVESCPPPAKKRRQAVMKGKENKTRKQQQLKIPVRATKKKPGTILVVGSEPLKEVTFNIQTPPAQSSPPSHPAPSDHRYYPSPSISPSTQCDHSYNPYRPLPYLLNLKGIIFFRLLHFPMEAVGDINSGRLSSQTMVSIVWVSSLYKIHL